MIRQVLGSIIILLVPFCAFADPAITSAIPTTTWVHGNVITIGGTDFGAHADYNDQSDMLSSLMAPFQHHGT